MTRRILALPVLAASLFLALAGCNDEPPLGDAVTVPSGREVAVLDLITDVPGPKGATARFRFVVSGLTSADDPSADMLALCSSFAVPRLADITPEPQQIIIVFADRAVPFGESAPDAVQFFEAYGVKNETCIWEMF